jgi:hypothetical protein
MFLHSAFFRQSLLAAIVLCVNGPAIHNAAPPAPIRAAAQTETRQTAPPVLRQVYRPNFDPAPASDGPKFDYRNLYNGGMTEEQMRAMD